ncbi:MAG TPA: HEAT repeat domain-containing protein [Fimbriimonas sp.]|nr:HEAT repeat domain-containing protein [Fimbriimonas sp.]
MLLMHMLGEETFWKCIHAFLEKYKFLPATTDDFFAVTNEVSGINLDSFKKQWLYTAATPSVTASLEGTDLVVTQLQPYYSLKLPVWILDRDRWSKNEIDVEGATSRLNLGNLSGKPLLIDPEAWVPMELRYQIPYSATDVKTLYRHAPNAAAKARIIAVLFNSIPVADRVSLAKSERVPGLLQMIADHIGQEGEDYLLELLNRKDRRVANSAVGAIGRLGGDDRTKQALSAISLHDPNEALREHAAQVLLGWSSDDQYAKTLWGMKAFDDGYRISAMEWFGSHEPDYARTLALSVLRARDSEPLRVAAIHVLGAVKESGSGHEVYDALIEVAQENAYSARIAAISALGQLGNKAAIPVLEPITTHGPDAVEGAAKAAIEA